MDKRLKGVRDYIQFINLVFGEGGIEFGISGLARVILSLYRRSFKFHSLNRFYHQVFSISTISRHCTEIPFLFKFKRVSEHHSF
jgi:hypothetical protein